MGILNAITEGITGVLFSIVLWLDRVIYSFINYLYKLFLILAQTRIISSEEISGLIRRVYILIGVVMLFVLAYGLLNAVINPAAKDKNTSFKTIVSVIKAIVLIAIVPTAFDLAYAFQVAVVKQNTIGKVILGGYTTVDSSGNKVNANQVLNDAGINIAVSTFQAFVVPIDGETEKTAMIGDSGMSLQDVWDEALDNRSLKGISILSEELKKDANSQSIDYSFIVSTLAGAFLAWQLLKYCLSLGSRCIKLAFYELIAPAPILLSIMPSKKNLMSDWLKDVVTLFLEVFIRIMVLYIAVFLIAIINEANISAKGIFGSLSGRYKAMAFAILIMGLISFVGSAPDLIGKALGVDTKNLKKGVSDLLKEGGAFMAGGVAMGAAGGLVRGAVNGGKKWKKRNENISKDDKGSKKLRKVGSGIRGMGGILFGGLGGVVKGGMYGYNKDSGSFSDMVNNGKNASMKYGEKLDEENNYLRDHGDRYLPKFKKGVFGSGSTPKLGIADGSGNILGVTKDGDVYKETGTGRVLSADDIKNVHYYDDNKSVVDSKGYLLENGKRVLEKGVVLGRASYAASGVTDFFGLGNSIDKLTKQIEALNNVTSSTKALSDAIMNKIKSEAGKGKSDLAFGDYSATALKALNAVLTDKNAGQSVNLETLKESLRSLELDDTTAEFNKIVGEIESRRLNLNQAGVLEAYIGQYEKAFTDVFEDSVLAGNNKSLFDLGVSKELDGLRTSIANGFKEASDIMSKAGYSLIDASKGLTVADIKKHNKYSASQDSSLEYLIKALGDEKDKLIRERSNDAGSKDKDKK